MSCVKVLIRRKLIDWTNLSDTKLKRCLTTCDLTFLGIGSTLGAGIYVVAGQVAKDKAGPAVVLSFIVAAIASILAGLCYAEFGSRVPKTGSAYIYSYVTVGEFAAFVIGWNLILEYVIGTSSVARAASIYFDNLIGKPMATYLRAHLPMDIDGFSPYPDFFSFLLVLVVATMLAIGVKESATFNTIFTCLNLFVVTYVIICGLFRLDFSNWSIPKDQITDPETQGQGGFFPFGVSGMLSGAATCFYAFVGFDVIATTGEEVKNPSVAIPISILSSLTIITLAYVGVSCIMTLTTAYVIIDAQVPLPDAFDRLGWPVARYIIAVGAIAALSTSLLGAMFPLPRILYAMADDRLIFSFLSKVNRHLKTPLIATVLSGLFAGLMAMLFDLEELVNMMSIGTLLAYTLVGECVLILRYMTDEALPISTRTPSVDTALINNSQKSQCDSLSRFMKREVTHQQMRKSLWLLLIINICVIVLSALIVFLFPHTTAWWAITICAILGAAIAVSFVTLCFQPQNQQQLKFKVPLVPLLPTLSVFINVYLMFKLPNSTWIRFGVWMAIGLAVYFSYGIRKAAAKTSAARRESQIIYRPIVDQDDSS